MVRRIRENGNVLQPDFGVSGCATTTDSAAAAVGASNALKQKAQVYGGKPGSDTQSMRVHRPGALLLDESFCAIR